MREREKERERARAREIERDAGIRDGWECLRRRRRRKIYSKLTQ